MLTESFAHETALLALPPIVSGLRVRYAGGEGRGRFQVVFCNNRARAIPGGESDRQRVEAVVQCWLDANLPSWASGQPGSGSIWIDLTSGETRLIPDAAG
jgi:hypothetical protein